MNTILELIYITMMPLLELRASIPYGILKADMHWLPVFLICCAANILIAPVLWFFIHYMMHIFLRVGWIRRFYDKTVERSVRKVHPYIEKYGSVGLALFIGVPLPGSGVYTGALAASILKFRFRDFILASVIGVLIAGMIVTALVMTGIGASSFLVKII